MTKNNNKEVLDNLNIKPRSQKVLLFLLGRDTSPVSDIAFALNLPKSSVYDSLNELLENGLVTEYNSENKKEYGVVDPEQLARVSDQKIKKLQEDHKELLNLIKSTKKVSGVAKPKIRFYMGDEGIKQAFRDTLWHDKCSISYLMWPMKDMFRTMGLDFSIWHSHLRYKHQVYLKVIQTESDLDFVETIPGAKELIASEGWNTNCDTRTAPKDIKWRMSFWIYDNICLFASGGEEKIAFVVESKEFTDLMTILFKQMWEISNK